jgi:predicted XRE-type DNA-binding protein
MGPRPAPRTKLRQQHGKKNAVRVTASLGNVFRDLGFSKEESEHLLVRADLLIQVQKASASRGLKQAEAAKALRVTQPRISDLLRGRIDLFSTDALIDMLARLGVGVRPRAWP